MNIKIGKRFRLALGPRANNGKPAAFLYFVVFGWAFKIGAWAYGWENPAWYERFDHVRFTATMWSSSHDSRRRRPGDFGYGAEGLDFTLVIREDGAWRLPRRHK